MVNQTITTNSVFVNNSSSIRVSSVIEWVHAQERKSDMDSLTARLRITALEQFSQVIADDEPKDDVQWMLDHMNQLRERWARRHQDSKAATARSYASRASAAIREYFRWSEAPDKYTPSRKRKNQSDQRSSKSAKIHNKPVQEHSASQTNTPISITPEIFVMSPKHQEQCKYLLGKDGDTIIYQLPSRGIKVNEVKKFMLHLITMADDFDFASSEQAQIFSVAVRENYSHQ